MYETDATFNTNSLKLLLSVLVGIDNCGKTFPIAFCYITFKTQPLEISSDDESDGEPCRSSRVKRPLRAVESQQWQIEHGVIPAPSAKAKVRALNAKKKQNTKESQLDYEFKLIE